METSAIRGDGLNESMEWLAVHLGSTSGHSNRKQQSPRGSPVHKIHDVTNDSHDSHQKRDSSTKSSDINRRSDANSDSFDDVIASNPRLSTGSSPIKDVSPTKDFCHFNRAYSAFRCFFIRPSVPPDIDSDADD